MPSNRGLVLSFSLIFAGGILVGALGHRYYALYSVRAEGAAPAPNPEAWRKQFTADLNARLKLTQDQSQQLEVILDDTRSQVHDVRDRFRSEQEKVRNAQTERIRAMLTETQKAEFEKFRAEREKKRKEMEGRRKGAPKS